MTPSQITELSQKIYRNNKEKGFWDKERNIGEMLMLVISELSEALEASRNGNFFRKESYHDGESYIGEKAQNEKAFKTLFEVHVKDTFEDEIADAIIRLFDLAGGLGIDIGFHIFEKLEYNKTRQRLHGKKF